MGKGLDWGGIFFFKNLIQNGGGRGGGEEGVAGKSACAISRLCGRGMWDVLIRDGNGLCYDII